MTVTAKSDTMVCKLNLILKKVTDENKIYNKKDIQTSYRFENEASQSFNLNDFFGGKNLKYDIKGSKSKDVEFEIQHFKNFKQSSLGISEDIDLYRVVEIDEKSYWFITFSIEGVRFWQCTTSNSSINCVEDVKSKVPGNKRHILHA